jgi:gliding motility-associated-like protein/uncharacterized repeat protein (TIGR01451 family)
LENLGNVALSNLRATDDLNATFGIGSASFTVSTPVAGAGLTANGAYNGAGDTNLLSSGTLAVGETRTITFTVSVDLNGDNSILNFNNTAVGTANSPTGTPVTDDSTDGTDTDPNNNDDPSDDNTPTPVTLYNPVVGIAKNASAVTQISTGIYDVTYDMTIENLGNEDINNLQVRDDLQTAVYPAPAIFTIEAMSSTGGLTLNTATYDGGITDDNLLTVGNTLNVGAVATVSFRVRVNLNGTTQTVFNNNAEVSGTGVTSGGNTDDISDDGTNPDTSGNANPEDAGEDDPTVVTLTVEQIGVSKFAGIPTEVPTMSGVFDVPYTVNVENLGNIPARNVQVVENLLTGLPAGASIVSVTLPITDAPLVANATFDGVGNNNLLNGSIDLPAGASVYSINFTVRINTNGSSNNQYENQVVANTAAAPGGIPTSTDNSDDGVNPDGNGNGDPNDADENDPTVVTLSNPEIGIAKEASTPVVVSPNTFTVTYTIRVENLGNVPLTNIQVTDNLLATFPAPAIVTIQSVNAANGLFSTGTYTGLAGGLELLDITTGGLASGAVGRIDIALHVDLNGSTSSVFTNTAEGSAQGTTGGNTSDTSDEGTDPDPNGNGDAGDANEDDPTVITIEAPQIGIAKQAGTPVAVAGLAGVFDVPYTLTLENLGNIPAQNVQIVEDLTAGLPLGASIISVTTASVSPPLAVNPAFNGVGSNNLLSGNIDLPVGATTYPITFTVRVDMTGATGTTYVNQVFATTALVPNGTPTSTDTSDDGTNPDNGGVGQGDNGNPNDPNENDPTIVTLEYTQIGIAKSASTANEVTEGVYDVVYTITAENLGNVDLENVSITDNLAATFPAPITFVIQTPPTASGSLDDNVVPTFNGSGNNELLLIGGSTLPTGSTETVSFTVRLTMNGSNLTTFDNVALGQADGVGGVGGSTNDTSTDGTNPDPNNDGNPEGVGEDNPTTTVISNPVIGIAKTALGTPVQVAEGVYDIVYQLRVENLGNVDLENVSVIDNLSLTFPAPASFVIQSAPVATGSLDDNIVPAFDGGIVNNELLSAASTLAVGASETITFTVRLTMNGSVATTFNNTAEAEAKEVGGTQTTDDISDNGTDPDPNGNGNPENPGEDTPTSITVLSPRIGVAKSAGIPVFVSEGVYDITYTLEVENFGNVALEQISVIDNLTTTFPAPATASIQIAPNATGTLQVNPLYSGTGANTDLLTPASTLAIGGSASITFTARISMNGTTQTVFNNTAEGEAQGAGGTGQTDDTSEDGANPDPNNNGSPEDAGEDTPTTSVILSPRIGVAKSAGNAVFVSEGVYDVNYTFTVENLGNVDLENITVIDNLALTYPAPASTSIQVAPNATGTLGANAAYNGTGNNNLLTAGSTLPVGATETITMTVRVTMNGTTQTSFNNTATATGEEVGGTGTTDDTSEDGTNPDPNNNGDPENPGEDTPTTTDILSPRLGIAKTAGAAVFVSEGVYDVTYVVKAENLGNVDLQNVSVIDDLLVTFPAPASTTIQVAPNATGTLSANAAYTGTGINTDLLDPASTLAVGANATITFTVRVSMNGTTQVNFDNTAVGEAQGVGGSGTTNDTSENGTNTDPNSNGNPEDAGEDTPTPLVIESPRIAIAKSAGNAVLVSEGVYDVAYTFTVENLGNVDLENISVLDDLTATYPAPASTSIQIAPNATGTLATNGAYNGTGNNNLLDAGSTLTVGSTETITMTVRVTMNGTTDTAFNNTAVAQGDGVGGTGTTDDVSDDGTNPDPNNNGDPENVGEDTPTTTDILSPRIGVAKSAGTPVMVQEGIYDITYTFQLENFGNVNLENVSLVDDLAVTFPAPTSFVIQTAPNATGNLQANAGYTGTGANTNLLTAGSTLAIGATESVTLTVRLTMAGTNDLTFSNTATAQGDGVGGAGTTDDVSDDGINPDTNNNANPEDGGEDTPTDIVIRNPRIGIAKSTGAVTKVAQGVFDIPITMTVENLGNVDLENVSVIDNLNNTFANPITFTIQSLSATGTFNTDAAFDGDANTELLLGTSTLPIGQTETIDFVVRISLNGSGDRDFLNSATAEGKDTGGTGTTDDTSESGTDPDPNGNDDPEDGGEDTPTGIHVDSERIAIAKAAGTPVRVSAGVFDIEYTITVENMGNLALENVSVTDDLAAAFPAPATTTIQVAPNATGTLNANPAFDGTNDMLLPSSTLAIGDVENITFTVRVNLNGSTQVNYDNLAVGTATGPGGVGTTTDDSTDGTDPDPNGNGNPEEDTPTPSVIENPVIGIAKDVATPVQLANGSYDITYTMTVENLGNIPLTSVEVIEDLNAVFGGLTFNVLSGSMTASGDLDVDNTFNGTSNTNLVLNTSNLAVGGLETVSFTVNVEFGAAVGTYNNTAVANGDGNGTPVTDDSETGTNPDPDDNFDPTDNDTPTSITIPPSAEIGLAKTVSTPVLQVDNSYNITYTMTVVNSSFVDLGLVQVVDNLTNTFPLPTTFAVITGSITADGDLQANPNYDGNADTNLLIGTGTLLAQSTGTITLTVNIVTNGNFGVFENTATAEGTGAGLTVTDVSTDGTDADPDGNGDPTDNEDETPISFTPNPVIGVAKEAGLVRSLANGSYEVDYTISVENLGNAVLTDVQVVDDLNSTFNAGVEYVVNSGGSSVSGGGINPNPSFNGDSNNNLLGAGSTLAVGEVQTITFTVKITPDTNFGPYNNTAVATAIGDGKTVNDVSVDGTNADPNDDNNPEESEPTSFTLNPSPAVGVAKVADDPILLADGTYNVTYTVTVENFGNVILENVKVIDNLRDVFASPAKFRVLNGSVASGGGLESNPSYNGSSIDNLLGSGSTLDVGETGSITFTVNVTPNGNFGVFENTAVVTAEDPRGNEVTDDSVDGVDPDGTDDDDNPDEEGPTNVEFEPDTRIGVAKSASEPRLQSDGTFSVTYTMTVENFGNTVLEDVQILDNLTTVFPAPSTFEVVGGSRATGALVGNPSFNGATNSALLAGGSRLRVGETATVSFTVSLTPNGSQGPFDNLVTATATDQFDTPTSDDSVDGLDPDGTDNDDQPDETSPTTITVPVTNEGPSASNDFFTMENCGEMFIDGNVLDNDIDPDNDQLRVTPVVNATTAAGATISIDANGNVSYLPPAGYVGTDEFTYEVCDNGTPKECTTALLTIRVDECPPENPNTPLAVDDVFQMDCDPISGVNILANDSDGDAEDTISAQSVSNATTQEGGTISIFANGDILYTPLEGFVGTDEFAYTVCDDGNPQRCAEAIIRIEVSKCNRPPVPIDYAFVVENCGAINENLLPNNNDPDGDQVFATPMVNITTIRGGLVNLTSNGQFTYIPDENFEGTDTLTYEICDNGTPVACATGRIVITIEECKNYAPMAEDDMYTTQNCAPILGNVTENDFDFEDDSLTTTPIVAFEMESGGIFNLDDKGNFTYVPQEDFVGIDTISYIVCDNGEPSRCDTALVTIIVEECDIFVPEGFSPNGDGENDEFVIDGAENYTVDLRIFNRWGNLVYKSNDYQNDWTGTVNRGIHTGTQVPDGTYFYVVDFNDGNGPKARFFTIQR